MHHIATETSEFSRGEVEFEQAVHQLGSLYGITGLEVVVKPGEGWSCQRFPNRLTITVDPLQLIERSDEEDVTVGRDGDIEQAADPRFILHTTGHELGHARDFLDPSWQEATVDQKPSEHFFWNVINDAVIDTRLRRVPLFDASTDELYRTVLFPGQDLTSKPKHVQLMYGILLDTVTDNPLPALDEQVLAVVASLREYQKGDQTFNILDILTDLRTTLAERNKIARQFIWPRYRELLKEDKRKQTSPTGSSSSAPDDSANSEYDEYEDARHKNTSTDSGSGDDQAGDEFTPAHPSEEDSDSQGHAEKIAKAILNPALPEETTNDDIDQPEDDPSGQGFSLFKESAEEEEDTEAIIEELAGIVQAEMELAPGDAKIYAKSMLEQSTVIQEVAKIFMKLARPGQMITSPRYRRRSNSEGMRLHPNTMAQIALQIDSGEDQAIWQKVERRAARQEVSFNGLDFYLLVDISESMAYGGKAECAANTGLLLTEGLQLARSKAARQAAQNNQPDVRVQIIAFGSDTSVLCELTPEPTGQQKGKAYNNLLHPTSGSTLVNGALNIVQTNATQNPERDNLVFIVSDGDFGDFEAAETSVGTMPQSVHVAHFVIGEFNRFISPNHEAVPDPSVLPEKLYATLAEYIYRRQLA